MIFGLKDKSTCQTNILSSIPEDVLLQNSDFVKNFEIYGTLFSINSTILVFAGNEECTFGKTHKIIKTDCTIYFVLELYKETDFDEHTYSYMVKKTLPFTTVEFQNLPIFPPCSFHNFQEHIYVTTPYAIKF